MPEYPAVRRPHYCLLRLQIIFCLLGCFCDKWDVLLPRFLILKRSQQAVFQALCLRFCFGMDAFESTPLAFTSWLRSWRLVNCRVCNARGRVKGMQELVRSSTRREGAFSQHVAPSPAGLQRASFTAMQPYIFCDGVDDVFNNVESTHVYEGPSRFDVCMWIQQTSIILALRKTSAKAVQMSSFCKFGAFQLKLDSNLRHFLPGDPQH